jgi:transcriptional regulator with XRE-family HTH domain
MNDKQKTYPFVLVLKNIDENTPNLEDILYEAGCDDALINFRNGTVYLDFDRQAISLEEAVMSAIKDIEASSISPIVACVGPEDLVTESDVAKRLNIKRQAVSLWVKGERRNLLPFPKPIMKLSDKSPFWKWREIAEWLFKNNIIKEKEEVDNASFLENINAALEERDESIRSTRQGLLKKLVPFSVKKHPRPPLV